MRGIASGCSEDIGRTSAFGLMQATNYAHQFRGAKGGRRHEFVSALSVADGLDSQRRHLTYLHPTHRESICPPESSWRLFYSKFLDNISSHRLLFYFPPSPCRSHL